MNIADKKLICLLFVIKRLTITKRLSCFSRGLFRCNAI